MEAAQSGSEDTAMTARVPESSTIAKIQRQSLALANILTSIDATCKSMVLKLNGPAKIWKILVTMFQAVSEAATDEKSFKMHTIKLQNGEK